MITKKSQKEKGITLIALVITIIVLLILAAVTINLTLGERGIFNTAQLAAKNYTDAAKKEDIDLNSFENEVNETIKNATKNTLASQITAANYGDYVNYEDGLDLGSSTFGHATDWRVFYKDKDGYVYLILSYILKNSDLPTGTNLKGYEGRPYTSYWPTLPNSYTNVSQSTYDRYMMNFKYNGSPNNGLDNMKFVSELMDTSKWSKFVNKTYAEDAIGAPTLEMWCDSWNTKSVAKNLGWTQLSPSIANQDGYYINGGHTVSNLETSDLLYFPATVNPTAEFHRYWLASPTVEEHVTCIHDGGYVTNTSGNNDKYSVRPLVRLKNTVKAEKVDGIWKLE